MSMAGLLQSSGLLLAFAWLVLWFTGWAERRLDPRDPAMPVEPAVPDPEIPAT
ncbi:MAG TPA: hypothetical protein VFW71_14555 [Actinomycetota bacterium]|nr:hypothetical protein [Actinomycetota bacterium]